MWPYPWTHVGTPSHLGHMNRVAATMPSQAHAGAAQKAPDIGQWEGQDVPLVRPSSCNVKPYLYIYVGLRRGCAGAQRGAVQGASRAGRRRGATVWGRAGARRGAALVRSVGLRRGGGGTVCSLGGGGGAVGWWVGARARGTGLR